MDKSSVQISSNWVHIGGCSFSQCFQELAADPDFFTIPDSNEVIDEKKSLLLSKAQSLEYCELYIKLFAHIKIQAISLVCNVGKVEIFQGSINEYLKTIYGIVLDEIDDYVGFRYDVEVEKSGITDLTLRFLTDSSDVCIFGIILHTAPNPNGITTLSPNTGGINIQNVHNILQASTRNSNSNSDKCKKLLELIGSTSQCNPLPLHQNMEKKMNISEETATEKRKYMPDSIKSHIDQRFQEMELHINRCLEDMEQRQNKKLDKILSVIEQYNK